MRPPTFRQALLWLLLLLGWLIAAILIVGFNR